MIRYLIKNNFKIMFRSAVNILLFVLCPIVVSAVLISAFSSLMESYEPAEEFQVGYRIDKDSSYGEYMNMLKNVGDENGVTFVEYDEGDIEELIHQHELGGFVEFKGDSYKVYEINDRKVEGATLEYMMSAFFNSSLSGDIKDISLNIEKSEYAPAINSTDYYGIIYIVYFGWCAIVCAAGLFSNEKKNRIGERLQVSNLSVFQIYLARLIPIVTVVAIGICIAAVVSAFMMGVHWGNIAISVVVILLMIIAATASEMMIYEVTGSMVATIIISFGMVWILGFIGGSFETYMFSPYPESLKQLSPIYHGNRALTELSSMGESDYVLSSIIYSTVLIFVSSFISLIAGKLRRNGR